MEVRSGEVSEKMKLRMKMGKLYAAKAWHYVVN